MKWKHPNPFLPSFHQLNEQQIWSRKYGVVEISTQNRKDFSFHDLAYNTVVLVIFPNFTHVIFTDPPRYNLWTRGWLGVVITILKRKREIQTNNREKGLKAIPPATHHTKRLFSSMLFYWFLLYVLNYLYSYITKEVALPILNYY